MSTAFPAARVKFAGNVVCCSLHRTFDENLAVCFQALALLTNLSVDELTRSEHVVAIEAYRTS